MNSKIINYFKYQNQGNDGYINPKKELSSKFSGVSTLFYD